jgi:hypothetical protein
LTWIALAHLLGIGIGRVKQDGGKYYVENFLAGYALLIIISLIYLITNT